MSTGYIDLRRDPFLDEGVSPRQRNVFLMRWNPSISLFNRNDFEEYFNYFKGKTKTIENPEIVWNIWDWKKVMHRDLFVMMQVGQQKNGLVWGGFLNGYPFQSEDDQGRLSKSHYIDCTVMYMHRIERTNLLSEERLTAEIPEVDWLHGHSGELLSVESAEKLGLLLVDELRKADENDDVYFDNYEQKKYVLQDILTYMCPALKKRLQSMGKSKRTDITDVNELMVEIEDKDYMQWTNLEEHLTLDKIDDILL